MSRPNRSKESSAITSAIKVIVASDHAAVAARALVVETLASLGYVVQDVGPTGEESVDYPDYAQVVGEAVGSGKSELVRAALVHDVTGARLSRQHNDANVLVLGGGMMGERLLKDVVEAWTGASFEGGRHQGRVNKITALEGAGRGSSR
jgi:ribose 5-phosphate isomerase B